MSRPPNTFLIIYLFDWFRLRRNAMADAPYEDSISRSIASHRSLVGSVDELSQCCQLSDCVARFSFFPDPPSDLFSEKLLATNLATFSGDLGIKGDPSDKSFFSSFFLSLGCLRCTHTHTHTHGGAPRERERE